MMGFIKVEDESGTCNECCFNEVGKKDTRCVLDEYIPDAPCHACAGGYFIVNDAEILKNKE